MTAFDQHTETHAVALDQQQQQQQTLECTRQQQELTKLRAIETRVQQIRDKLTTRLPLQRRLLAARVCGVIWAAHVRVATMTPFERQAHVEQLAKKLRLELGAFDYQAKEQGELLTRELCALDDILSNGDAAIKSARKALVVAIQTDALPIADVLREQSTRLKAFGEALLPKLLQSAEAAAASTAAQAPSMSTKKTTVAAPNVASDSSDVQMSLQSELDNTENDVVSNNNNTNDANGCDDDDDDDNGNDNNMDEDLDTADAVDDMSDSDAETPEDDMDTESDEQSSDGDDVNSEQNSDIQSLPVWRPYYELQRRHGGLCVVANLRGVEPAHVDVQWLERAGVLRIAGYKLPTRKDLAVSRFSGVPTFGRFEILERLPTDVFAVRDATHVLRADGTLEISLPFAATTRWQRQCMQPTRRQLHPSLFGGSLFSGSDAARCMVW